MVLVAGRAALQVLAHPWGPAVGVRARQHLLRQAGCEPGLAWELAADGDIDLLAPLDRGP